MERVCDLVEKFKRSAIHNDTVVATLEDSLKYSSQTRDALLKSRTKGPGYLRVMYTLLR